MEKELYENQVRAQSVNKFGRLNDMTDLLLADAAGAPPKETKKRAGNLGGGKGVMSGLAMLSGHFGGSSKDGDSEQGDGRSDTMCESHLLRLV